MQAGLLRDSITIEHQVVTRSATTGDQITAWSTLWAGRARVSYSSGSQVQENGETWNTVTRQVTIRTKPLISESLSHLRVLIGTQYYRVLSMDVRHWDMATVMNVELINE